MDNNVTVINNGISIKSAAVMIGEVAEHCRAPGKPVTRQMVYRLVRMGYITKVARGIVSLDSVKSYVNARKNLQELKGDANGNGA